MDDDEISLTSTVIDNPNSENNVEVILAKRDFYGRAYYLVKWEGFPIEQATWEPIESFTNAKEAVDCWKQTQAAIDRGDEHSAELVAKQQDAIEAVRVREERRKRRRILRARLAEERLRNCNLKMEPREEEDESVNLPGDHLQTAHHASTPTVRSPIPTADAGTTSKPSVPGTPSLSPLALAANAYREGQFANPHQAARVHGVDYHLLRNKLGLNKGGTPVGAENRYKRLKKLTEEEEQEVADYFLARKHDPLPKSEIAVKATEILRRRDPTQSVSQGWIDLFLKRQPELRKLYPPGGTKRKSTSGVGLDSPPRRYASDTPDDSRQRHHPVEMSDVESNETTIAATTTTTTTTPTANTSVTTYEPLTLNLALRPGPDTVRFKLRTETETRYLLVNTNVRMQEFLQKIKMKLGLIGQFKLHVRDEGDMVTIGDQEDLNILLALAKEGHGVEVNISGVINMS